MTKRIIWKINHMQAIVEAALPLLRSGMKILPAIRAAQEKALEQDMRRNLVTIGQVPDDLLKMIDLALKDNTQGNAQDISGTSKETASAPTTAAEASAHAPSSTAADAGHATLAIEAAFIVALQSPRVQQALVDLFAEAIKKASAVSQQPTEQAQRGPTDDAERVLVVGFNQRDAERLSGALSDHHETRILRANQPAQVISNLMKICQVALIPEESPDDVEEHFRSNGLRVIQVSPQIDVGKLIERLAA